MATATRTVIPVDARKFADPDSWNPRWLQWCRAIGQPNPASKDLHGYDFIAWISRRWSEWNRETKHVGGHSEADHAAFDQWLVGRVDALLAEVR